jgi:hypothetical protein
MFPLKRKPTATTAFSEFIRNASSEEKKRVYKRVLENASASQKKIIAEFATDKKS